MGGDRGSSAKGSNFMYEEEGEEGGMRMDPALRLPPAPAELGAELGPAMEVVDFLDCCCGCW